MQPLGKYYALLTLAGILWGAQPLMIKLVVREITPVTLTVARYALISATIFPWLLWKKEPRLLPSGRNLLLLLLMSLCGVTINNVAQFTGLQYSTVTNATLIAATTPAVTAILAVTFMRERLIFVQWLGLIISLVGTVSLVSHGSWRVLANLSFNVGDMLFFLGQTGWAVYALLSMRVMREISAFATVAWVGAFGSLLTMFYGLMNGELYYAPLSPPGAAFFVYITWGGGVCAMICWNMGVKAIGASQATIFLNLMPLVGIVSGVLFLGESFRVQESFGALGILSGVYLITHSRQIRKWRERRSDRNKR